MVGVRQINLEDIEEEIIEDETNNTIINEAVDQEATEQRVQEQLYENDITQRASKTPEPSTPPNPSSEEGLSVDPDLLSPQLDRLRINLPQELDDTPTTALRQKIQINQQHANERAKRQYGKQRQTTTYEIDNKVSVAIPALDRASTDDKRIFERVIDVIEEYDSYRILTKHGLLNRNYPISELNPLPKHIDLSISNPPPTNHVTLHYYTAQESTAEKVPVHCNCRDEKT